MYALGHGRPVPCVTQLDVGKRLFRLIATFVTGRVYQKAAATAPALGGLVKLGL